MLTKRVALAAEMGVGSRVLDIGSGRGASAVHLAETLHCSVVGITPEPDGVTAARQRAQAHGVTERATFIEGDIQRAAFADGSFDIALMECVLSILPEKVAALRHIRDALCAEGRLAITDVTADSGELPDHLRGVLAVAGCVGAALSLADYRDVVHDAGFVVEAAQNLPEVAGSFLRDVRGKLMMAEAAIGLGKLPTETREYVTRAKQVVTEVESLVQRGVLGYALIVARRA